MKPKSVYVYPGLEAVHPKVWEALKQLLPVNFTGVSSLEGAERADAVIVLSGVSSLLPAAGRLAKPCFCFEPGSPLPDPAGRVHRAAFGASQGLDARLRGRQVDHNAIQRGSVVAVLPGDEILASLDGQPVWVKRSSSASSIDLVSLPPPPLEPEQYPLEYCCGSHFLQLIPLIHFLRSIAGEDGWRSPGLRACFMFDDPNLHWDSYGFLPYGPLVDLCETKNCHVSFATVPLDCWWFNEKAARLFRPSAARLSLLFHGSNHLHAELLGTGESTIDEQLIAQAFRRILDFETRSGVRVSRSMAAPHGACSTAMMRIMLSLGMEGACISPWSLRLWNKGFDWGPAFGLLPAEITAGAFPVCPRFKMCDASEGDILVSAFLDRPIVPVGHHDTLSEGLELLGRLANSINALGPVTWGNLDDVQRSNYLIRRQGDLLEIRPFSSHFELLVPNGVSRLKLVAPDQKDGGAFSPFQIRRAAAHGPAISIPWTQEEEIGVREGERISVTASLLGSVDYRKIVKSSLPVWALARRVMCEARDRVRPVIRRIKGGKTAASQSY